MAYATINKPNQYFDTILYTGDGAASRTITGLNFSTDLIWYKRRNAVGSNRLIDTVRGIDKNIASDLTNAEQTESTYVTAINSDGWDIGNNTDVNTNNNTMAVWNWRASDSSAVSNTNGSITSTVSANTTSGFSIVSFTGTGSNATVGHGLSSAPDMIFFKNRSSAVNWSVYARPNGAGYGQFLNTTAAKDLDSSYFNNTDPTTSVFSVGTNSFTNGSGNNIIAYCFSSIKGYSKIGSYTGNGSDDGTFIYTGFKPAMIIVKKTSATGDWTILDNKRNTGNVVDKRLYPYLSNAEDTTNCVDFLSNGFKTRNAANGHFSASGATFIYMAFSENPLVTTSGIPATAR